MHESDIERMNRLTWYHKIELAPGVVTPGYDWDIMWDPIKEQLDRIDFSNKRVLDIGSWDGMWAFEAERRGASYVLATDYFTARWSDNTIGLETFSFAKAQLCSKVEFEHCSVYALSSLGQEFDMVMCFGIIYHLRHPTLALDQCRSVLVDGGLCLVESAVIMDEPRARVELNGGSIYPGDPTTWCAHSEAAMKVALLSAYLDPMSFDVTLRQSEELGIGRGFWTAQAFSGQHVQHSRPYDGLE